MLNKVAELREVTEYVTSLNYWSVIRHWFIGLVIVITYIVNNNLWEYQSTDHVPDIASVCAQEARAWGNLVKVTLNM